MSIPVISPQENARLLEAFNIGSNFADFSNEWLCDVFIDRLLSAGISFNAIEGADGQWRVEWRN